MTPEVVSAAKTQLGGWLGVALPMSLPLSGPFPSRGQRPWGHWCWADTALGQEARPMKAGATSRLVKGPLEQPAAMVVE